MKILIVRTSSMGDLIHTLPVVEDIYQALPQAEVHWLAEKAFADIPLLHPFVQKIHIISWRKWRKNIFKSETWYKIKELKNFLKNEHYDYVIDSQGLIKSAIPAKWAQAKVYGLDKSCVREPLATLFYDIKIKLEKNKNIIWQNRELFAQSLAYNVNHHEVNYGASVPKSIHLKTIDQAYSVCIHAASRNDKLWPEASWQQLMLSIHEETQQHFYLTWGNEEEYQRSLRIAADYDFIHIAEKMNLLEAAFLLEHAQSVIGVDTGLLHLANIFTIPTVGIYITTSPQYLTLANPKAWQKNTSGISMPSVKEVKNLWQEAIKNSVFNKKI